MKVRSWAGASCLFLACLQHGASRDGEHGLEAPIALPALATPEPSALHPRAASRFRTPSLVGTGRRTTTTCYTATGHRTASGLWPREGMAANNTYPFGTRLRVEDVGVVTVQDRIGWGSELDLFMDSRAACIRFGRRQLRVMVLR